MIKYSYQEALEASIDYFNKDELAAKVFIDKYALKNNNGEILEKTPEDMHRRIAKEIARIEKGKFKKPLTESEIFKYLDKFERIVPQGSQMFGIGNPYQYVSLANCFLVESPEDSYAGILKTDEQIVQISKRRGGCVEENSFVKIQDKGILKIKNVQVGDKILSYDIHSKKSKYKTILDKYYTDVKTDNQIKVVLINGFEM